MRPRGLKGATGVVTKRVVGPSFAPPPYHLISDVSFPTIETLKATAASSGKEALTHGVDQFRRRTDNCGCH